MLSKITMGREGREGRKEKDKVEEEGRTYMYGPGGRHMQSANGNAESGKGRDWVFALRYKKRAWCTELSAKEMDLGLHAAPSVERGQGGLSS